MTWQLIWFGGAVASAFRSAVNSVTHTVMQNYKTKLQILGFVVLSLVFSLLWPLQIVLDILIHMMMVRGLFKSLGYFPITCAACGHKGVTSATVFHCGWESPPSNWLTLMVIPRCIQLSEEQKQEIINNRPYACSPHCAVVIEHKLLKVCPCTETAKS